MRIHSCLRVGCGQRFADEPSGASEIGVVGVIAQLAAGILEEDELADSVRTRIEPARRGVNMVASDRESEPGSNPSPTCSADLDRLRSLTCIKWTWYPDDVIPAWVADMDLAPAPVVVDAVRALVDRGDFGYNFDAARRLPETFSAWQERRHSWRPDPKRVRVFCDVMQAVEATLWLHTEAGDGVVLFTPVYHPFFPAITSTGRRIVECPLDPSGWRLDPERLASVIDAGTRVILTCDPHNPTGRSFDAEELAAIAEVAERHDLLIVSDEIWSDLVYPGHTHVPIASLSDETAARTVTISAASKAFNIAGLHCAAAHIGHEGVWGALESLPRHLLGAVGSPGAEATLAAWTAGEPWLEEVRAHLTRQRDHLADRLSAELPTGGLRSARSDLPGVAGLARDRPRQGSGKGAPDRSQSRALSRA